MAARGAFPLSPLPPSAAAAPPPPGPGPGMMRGPSPAPASAAAPGYRPMGPSGAQYQVREGGGRLCALWGSCGGGVGLLRALRSRRGAPGGSEAVWARRKWRCFLSVGPGQGWGGGGGERSSIVGQRSRHPPSPSKKLLTAKRSALWPLQGSPPTPPSGRAGGRSRARERSRGCIAAVPAHLRLRS